MADKNKSLWRKYKDSKTSKVIDPLMKYWTLWEIVNIIGGPTLGYEEGGQIKKKKKIKKYAKGGGVRKAARYS
tara:strand:+ start:571 stop:789 length:219 start_codon:yes stop_codon:yes gene_type:complete